MLGRPSIIASTAANMLASRTCDTISPTSDSCISRPEQYMASFSSSWSNVHRSVPTRSVMDRFAAGLMDVPLYSTVDFTHLARASPVGADNSSTSLTGRRMRKIGLLAPIDPSVNIKIVVLGIWGIASPIGCH